MKTYRPRQGPNLTTLQKIQKLAEYRADHHERGEQSPSWTSACRNVGINHRTVRRHAPELQEKWYDETFRW